MKRKISRKSETSKRSKSASGVRPPPTITDSFAWELVIRKLDYRSQMKLSQQNHHLADIVEQNADHRLRIYRRHLQEDKYL